MSRLEEIYPRDPPNAPLASLIGSSLLNSSPLASLLGFFLLVLRKAGTSSWSYGFTTPAPSNMSAHPLFWYSYLYLYIVLWFHNPSSLQYVSPYFPTVTMQDHPPHAPHLNTPQHSWTMSERPTDKFKDFCFSIDNQTHIFSPRSKQIQIARIQFMVCTFRCVSCNKRISSIS